MIWVDIPGYVGIYQASTCGWIRSLDRTDAMGRCVRGRVLKQYLRTTHRYTFMQVQLSKAGKYINYNVCVLVARAFIGERPDGHEVCHGPTGSTDNSVGNLRYDTPENNRRDIITHRKMVGTNLD